MIPANEYANMSSDQKALHNQHLIRHLVRLRSYEPEIAREAASITNTIFTNKPDLNAPRAVVEAYAALCVHQKHKPWMPPAMFARLKTWLNYAGAQMDD